MQARSGTLPREIAPSIMPRWARRTVQGRMKSAVREAVCATTDIVDRVAGRRTPLTPSCRLRVRVGCFLAYMRLSRYQAVADEFLTYLFELGGLNARTRFLDIGCGCGQIAAPLTRVLGDGGAYDGFDPDPEAIEWCVRNISARYPNFRFTHADIENTQYNPGGGIRADRFQFPYGDAAFDLVLLKSVFTHLQRPAFEQYLSEIRRMLAPGGHTIASFLLLNDESAEHIRRGASSVVFPFQGEGCRLFDERTPEYLVAHDEQSVRDVAAAHGLAIESIAYGSWCGRPRFLSYQDLVIFSQAGGRA